MKMDQITHSRDDVRPTLGFGSNKYTRYIWFNRKYPHDPPTP